MIRNEIYPNINLTEFFDFNVNHIIIFNTFPVNEYTDEEGVIIRTNLYSLKSRLAEDMSDIELPAKLDELDESFEELIEIKERAITQKFKETHIIFVFFQFFAYFQKQNFNFINHLVSKNISLSKKFILYLYILMFLFILFSNIIGLIPFTYTLTSSFIVTLFFALIMFLFINILAIYKMGILPFVSIFLPNGTPTAIIPLLILIEGISYISRVFSLAIRLFANMMAGHTLLKILIAFTFVILCNSPLYNVLLPWLIVVFIVILEILISFLQAYVFIILLCIYLNDIQKGAH